jgi:DNA-binding transcriptional LysR family regulator
VHLETLRLYCDVVRLRSFSRGAEQNFVSQSAARRAFVVTREGDAFYGAARGILESWEKAKTEVAAVKARVDGTVRVAAIYSVGLHDMSRPMQRFMSLYPDARVQLECLHPHKVVEAVLTGEADIGVMSYPPAERGLRVLALREEPMALVCHPGHRLARQLAVTPAELAGEAFIAFDPGLTIRKAIDRVLRQHNVRVNIVMEFDNIETIKQAIIIAAGISILPYHTVSIKTLAAVDLGMPDLVRPVGIVHRRQKPLTPTAERFVQMLHEAGGVPRAVARERLRVGTPA